ncbi:MAG: GTPase obg [Candidatus Daviesbacteria bacterium GW2011_GWA1_38_7]|nr:MAG: GTPase obg [Candidatus Daviesbacteria bacterium GW2011_GWA1_38_7]
MFIDEAEVVLKAGHGGVGRASFSTLHLKAGPDGGNGGKGGDVYIRATSDLTALRNFTHTKIIAAEDGEQGGKNRKSGHDGKDIEIILPVGSGLTDIETGEEIELTEPSQRVLVCKGGIGGKGNFELRSPRRTTPKFAQKGLPGDIKAFKINLKLIANFGLIGLPNAGKSSLLNELTRASAKTADYPFTTLEPNLGVCVSKILADIPGLIEGASEGRGLGIKFLKHIEKTSNLLHCITANSQDLLNDYEVVRNELKKYNPALLDKKETILITKTDLVDKETLKEVVKSLKKLKKDILPVSVYDYDSIQKLKETLNC